MFTCKFKYASIASLSIHVWVCSCEHLFIYIVCLVVIIHMCTYLLLFWFFAISVCMHICCISQLCWVFLLVRSLGLHTQVHIFLCMCAWGVSVYWPWLAAPAGAPWWPQGSCPAGSAAHTQSEPTSLLCPFLPAATHTPDIHTWTYTPTHTDAHTRTCIPCTHFVHVYI